MPAGACWVEGLPAITIYEKVWGMSAQEMLLEEIKRQRAEAEWADVLPSREVEQEVLDILDGK